MQNSNFGALLPFILQESQTSLFFPKWFCEPPSILAKQLSLPPFSSCLLQLYLSVETPLFC